MIPTETRYWDASKTWGDYTLFGTGGKTYLIDFEGHVVHTWARNKPPTDRERHGCTMPSAAIQAKSATWKELDWNGNTIWQYTESRTGYWPHHDFEDDIQPET